MLSISTLSSIHRLDAAKNRICNNISKERTTGDVKRWTHYHLQQDDWERNTGEEWREVVLSTEAKTSQEEALSSKALGLVGCWFPSTANPVAMLQPLPTGYVKA